MAKTLSLLGENRKLFAMDLFETHMMDPTATMCMDEIQRRLDSAYPHCETVVGLIDDPKGLARIPGAICFAHIDLGPIPGALELVWEKFSPALRWCSTITAISSRQPGPLMLSSKPRGRASPGWSEQGLVFKRP